MWSAVTGHPGRSWMGKCIGYHFLIIVRSTVIPFVVTLSSFVSNFSLCRIKTLEHVVNTKDIIGLCIVRAGGFLAIPRITHIVSHGDTLGNRIRTGNNSTPAYKCPIVIVFNISLAVLVMRTVCFQDIISRPNVRNFGIVLSCNHIHDVVGSVLRTGAITGVLMSGKRTRCVAAIAMLMRFLGTAGITFCTVGVKLILVAGIGMCV